MNERPNALRPIAAHFDISAVREKGVKVVPRNLVFAERATQLTGPETAKKSKSCEEFLKIRIKNRLQNRGLRHVREAIGLIPPA